MQSTGAGRELGRAPLNCCCSGRGAAQPACGTGAGVSQSCGRPGLEEAAWSELLLSTEELKGQLELPGFGGVLSSYSYGLDDVLGMYNTFATYFFSSHWETAKLLCARKLIL